MLQRPSPLSTLGFLADTKYQILLAKKNSPQELVLLYLQDLHLLIPDAIPTGWHGMVQVMLQVGI